ncbi:hypothetical protein [Ralstonia sp.]|uniref:hypothetical protein n=1 Tax=Ralstonia sp. TaxID=54061 RepID=UPI0031CFE9BC
MKPLLTAAATLVCTALLLTNNATATTDEALSEWHYVGGTLTYGGAETDGLPLYVSCESGRLKATVATYAEQQKEGQPVKVKFSSSRSHLTVHAHREVSDMDWYATGEVKNLAHFYALFQASGQLIAEVDGQKIAFGLNGAAAAVEQLKKACPIRKQ